MSHVPTKRVPDPAGDRPSDPTADPFDQDRARALDRLHRGLVEVFREVMAAELAERGTRPEVVADILRKDAAQSITAAVFPEFEATIRRAVDEALAGLKAATKAKPARRRKAGS